MNKLYKVDENENIREWSIELIGDKFRVHSGVLGGKIVTSGWKFATPKNVGKINSTTAEEQAALQVDRLYANQLETGGYYKTIEEAKNGERTYFKCMLAHKWENVKKKVSYPLWSQPKLDGVRCIVDINSMKSRNGKKFVSSPHIMDELSEIFENNPNIIFDGELYNHSLKDDFEKIISLTRKTKPTEDDIIESSKKVEYHVYDMFDSDNPDLNFVERQEIIKSLLSSLNKIVIVETIKVENDEQLDELYGEYLEDGYEGQMVRSNMPYENGRSNWLLKRKEFEDAEFKIAYLESGVGNWAGACKRVYIKLENDVIQKSGVRGTFPVLEKMLLEKEEYVETEVTIRFQGRTSDGKLRFPVAVYFWKGKRDI
jgi:DNA ligase-1